MLTKFWNNLTTKEISKLSRNTILIAPFSAIEQHGSHLPLNTDKIILDKLINKFLVSPNCFFPKPKINSMVIHFQPKYQNFYNIKKISNLEKVTNILFSNKRKMINKNIKKLLNKDKIAKMEKAKK